MRILIVLVVLVSASAAMAQEPQGCDKFKWPVEREHALLKAATTKVAFGPDLPEIPAQATRIELQPFDKTTLPLPPERVPRDTATFAGFLKIAKVAKPGLYAIGLSTNGWIDAVQNGKHLKTVAFSGVTGCEGIRKVVKFELSDAPLVVRVTGVAENSIAIVIAPSGN
jgi:hypothetical protein